MRTCASILLPLLFAGAAISDHGIKRSFSEMGCMGVYDKAKFARLYRVCEECYQLFRESDVHTKCRSNCFKNTYFDRCVETLMQSKEQHKLENMVDAVYGRR